MSTAPRDAGTVPIRVQIIDIEARVLDLVVPTFLEVGDLTQRIARDAGLGAYWPDGSRRVFWLRARGRVLAPDEKLQDVGVVPWELLHLLPEPPPGAAVAERPAGITERRFPPQHTLVQLLPRAAGLLALVAVWAVGAGARASVWAGWFPAAGVALLATTLVRLGRGGDGSQARLPLIAAAVWIPLVAAVAVIPALGGSDPWDAGWFAAASLTGGVVGGLVGWLAWFGAAEPAALPAELTTEEHAEATLRPACGLCGGGVDAEVLHRCPHGCPRIFHAGCHRARLALVDDASRCAVCGEAVRGASG